MILPRDTNFIFLKIKIRVIIELLPEFEEVEGDYGMMVEGTTNSLMKVLVPIDQLCLLAKYPSVGFIRPSLKPIPFSHSTSASED